MANNYFTNEDEKDITDKLSQGDLAELVVSVNEPFGKDTESLSDFKKATSKWRIM